MNYSFLLFVIFAIFILLLSYKHIQPLLPNIKKPAMSPNAHDYLEELKSNQETNPLKKSKVKFKDVAGIDEVRKELIEIVEFIKNPDKYSRLGGKMPKGILLSGPPGVGKTLLAKAVAGEAGVSFKHYAGSEFVELYVGVGAKKFRKVFNDARKQAPCIIFFDEIDAIGKRKDSSFGGHEEYHQTINQLLVEMDGFEPNTGVFIIGATNRLKQLDEAFLRPGRFDRIIHVHLPDVKGREEILNIHATRIVLDSSVNLKKVAKKMTGSSGADLANLVNEAALLAARDENKTAVTAEDFERARDIIMLGNENRSLSLVMTEEEKRVIAFHEAGHAIVALAIPGSDPIDKITIIPRGQSLGTTSLMPEKDRYNSTRDYLEELVSILLAGRIAEEICLNTITIGAQNDIERVTEIVREMVMSFGMSELGLVNYKLSAENPWSEETRREVDAEIRQIIKKAENRSRELLKSCRKQLEKLAHALLEKETILRDEIEKILDETQDPI